MVMNYTETSIRNKAHQHFNLEIDIAGQKLKKIYSKKISIPQQCFEIATEYASLIWVANMDLIY